MIPSRSWQRQNLCEDDLERFRHTAVCWFTAQHAFEHANMFDVTFIVQLF